MCALNLNFWRLVFFLLLLPLSSALAKQRTFANSSIFSVGFAVGGLENPSTTLVPTPITDSGSFSTSFAFMPVFDFRNFVVEPQIALLNYSLLTARGFDSTASSSYRQSTDAYTVTYGARLKLIPLIFAANRARLFIGLGGGLASTSAKNQRDYLDAAGVITSSNQERAAGNGQFMEFFGGMDFFVVQNWSAGLVLGYRAQSVDAFTHEGDKNVRGNTVTKGDDVFSDTGEKASLTSSGIFGQLQFVVHF